MPILLGGSGGCGAGAMTQITNTTLSGAGTFDFTSIAGTFTSLYLVGQLRSSRAASGDTVNIIFNNDSGSNYADNNSLGLSTSWNVSERNTAANIGGGGNWSFNASTATANDFSATEILIPNYASTTWTKICFIRMLSPTSIATSAHALQFGHGFWNSTAAINRITLTPTTTPFTFVTGCQMTLYGIT